MSSNLLEIYIIEKDKDYWSNCAQSKAERLYGADEIEFNQLLKYNKDVDLDRDFIRRGE
jgi:hypothetical protein